MEKNLLKNFKECIFSKRSLIKISLILFLLVLVLCVTHSASAFGQLQLGNEIDPTIWTSEFNSTGDLRWLDNTDTQLTEEQVEGYIENGNLTITQKITFVFGEIIDNIVDGWIKITGSLEVTENLKVDGNITTVAEHCYTTSDNSIFCENTLNGGWCQNGTTYEKTITSNITKATEDGIWC